MLDYDTLSICGICRSHPLKEGGKVEAHSFKLCDNFQFVVAFPWGVAKRSESKIPMLAGGKHTAVE